MSNLINLDNICLSFGLTPLLDNIKLQVSTGERICLIGRNGAGKSSLLKIIAGIEKPDSGTIWRNPGLRIARLAQELPKNITSSVFDFVATGLAEIGELLSAYYRLTEELSHSSSPTHLQKLEQLQHAIEAKNGWQFEQDIKKVLQRLELDPNRIVSQLSGGWQRRVALAQALVTSPDLLLLDEPTNHLDIEAIQWLEDQLLSLNIGLIFITHDRALLQKLATRIIELDRGQLTSWPGDYQNFLRRKEEMLHAEAKQNSEFDKKLAQEEQWIRQGIKARRTRNEGRVRALEAMRSERSKRREVQGNVNLGINAASKSGQLVSEAKQISYNYNDKCLIKNFSIRIMRGDRIGLIGPNGIGKSTLLNILLNKLQPQQGSITQGTRLEIAYFDQLRAALEPEKTVADNVANGSDVIEINGTRKHIISYLADFLFTPQRALSPVKSLSGGECNRLLLARLFSQPANLLVMDEPTNDLDIETLELLEELLINYQGTLLIVSHDRDFLDKVVTSTLVFEGNGIIKEYIGGYQDWLRQKQATVITTKVEAKKNTQIAPKQARKLSYKEQKELNELPQRIEQLEAELAKLQQLTTTSKFYQQDQATITQTMNTLTQLNSDLEHAYKRWEELEQQ